MDFATITLTRSGGTSGVATIEVMTKEVIELPASADGGGYCGYWSYIGCTTPCNTTVAARWDNMEESEVLLEMFEYCEQGRTETGIDGVSARKDCFNSTAPLTLSCGLNGVAPSVVQARGALASTGRATSGTDYVPQERRVVVFPSGQPTVTHRISLRVDNVYEKIDEKFGVIIQNPVPIAVRIGDFPTALFEIRDDGDANLEFVDAVAYAPEDSGSIQIRVRLFFSFFAFMNMYIMPQQAASSSKYFQY